eukprot:TRINITY_DN41871_c0_g1_i1.p1 TRINITY_DN41871_c0_g1~~TRINITY_DN41871_c0_g1_i1.p1  ORF type:complete len:417 (-),score=127.79 TRINITY_DN41871_c0_g1_i1:207-1457(-)
MAASSTTSSTSSGAVSTTSPLQSLLTLLNLNTCARRLEEVRQNIVKRFECRARITRLSGNPVMLTVHPDWNVSELKEAVQKVTGVLGREQRLMHELKELQDEDSIAPFFENMENMIDLVLVRRCPLQAEWLEKVKRNPLKLKEAPDDIKADSVVVLAAANTDPMSIEIAAQDLWCDREFVLAAVGIKWDVWLSKVHPQLREDPEVAAKVISKHARALKHTSVELRKHSSVILAALHDMRAELRTGEPALARVWAQHVDWVFKLAAPELKEDAEFVKQAMKKVPGTTEHISPKLWRERDFVLFAVQENGLLLEKATDAIKADTEVVMAACTQHGRALDFAQGEARKSHDVALAALKQCGVLPEDVRDTFAQDGAILRTALTWRFHEFFEWIEGTNADRWFVPLTSVALVVAFLLEVT